MSAKSTLVARRTLTFMSEIGGACCSRAWRFRSLVRSSHIRLSAVFAAMSVCGCLFQEPPTWDPPKKTRPQLMDPVPSPMEIISVSHPEVDPIHGRLRLPIFVYERSEDDGDGLRAITFLDYTTNPAPAGDFQDIQEVPPGRYDEEKTISLEWEVDPGPARCVPLTLIVTHASNAPPTHFPIDNEDVATITWWLNLNNPGVVETHCPVRSGATQ